MNDTAAALINQYISLKEEATLIKDRMEAIKQALFELYPDGGNIEGHRLTLTKGRVNWVKVSENYSPETHPELYTLQFDPKKAEQHLPPIQLNPYRLKPIKTIR